MNILYFYSFSYKLLFTMNIFFKIIYAFNKQKVMLLKSCSYVNNQL